MIEKPRVENILQSIINDTEYSEEAQSRIEVLLLNLKNVIEKNGGSPRSAINSLFGLSDLQKAALLLEQTLIAGECCPSGYPLGCELALYTSKDVFYYPTEGQYGLCSIYKADDTTSTPIVTLKANPKKDAPYYIEFWASAEFTESLDPGYYILCATLVNEDGSDASDTLYKCPAFAVVNVGSDEGTYAMPSGTGINVPVNDN